MIEINLLPGAAKKSKSRRTSLSAGAMIGGLRSRVKDPYMLSAAASVVIAAAAVGTLYMSQSAKASDLSSRQEKAVRDSARFATVLRERRRAEAKRDSVLRQLRIIQSIDDDRFVWPHIMDEVSRALPPYTWLKSLAVLTTPATASSGGAASSNAANAKKDPDPTGEPARFRIIGHTADIQALTRFMKALEASPFIQNVQLARSELAMVDNREVTEFQLDAQYEHPDKAAITTAPVSLTLR